MTDLIIGLERHDSEILEKMLEREGLQYDASVGESADRFIPPQLKKIGVKLTKGLIHVLSDFLVAKKTRTKVIIKGDNIDLDLDADGLRKLKLLIDSRQ